MCVCVLLLWLCYVYVLVSFSFSVPFRFAPRLSFALHDVCVYVSLSPSLARHFTKHAVHTRSAADSPHALPFCLTPPGTVGESRLCATEEEWRALQAVCHTGPKLWVPSVASVRAPASLAFDGDDLTLRTSSTKRIRLTSRTLVSSIGTSRQRIRGVLLQYSKPVCAGRPDESLPYGSFREAADAKHHLPRSLSRSLALRSDRSRVLGIYIGLWSLYIPLSTL